MYNPDENCNCVIRSLSKMLEKNVINVKDELINLANEMNHIDYTDVEVFEKYMELNNIIKENKDLKDVQIKDIDFSPVIEQILKENGDLKNDEKRN